MKHYLKDTAILIAIVVETCIFFQITLMFIPSTSIIRDIALIVFGAIIAFGVAMGIDWNIRLLRKSKVKGEKNHAEFFHYRYRRSR